ncbi:MAG: shikimate kinase [Phycisphaerales bacterium]|jgi:shikimate kinase|nr:shikimate kinase [Phycisphaerales bacterium]
MLTIAFIGFRGSGKSTLGKWLAEELGVQFVDTDDEILKHLECESVTQAWEKVGEKGWREAELLLIPELLNRNGVIALGGGAPMIPAVSKALSGVPVVFNLTADTESTQSRISEGSDRPKLSEGDLDIRLKRLGTYAMLGTFGIDTSGDISESKSKILHFLNHGSTHIHKK